MRAEEQRPLDQLMWGHRNLAIAPKYVDTEPRQVHVRVEELENPDSCAACVEVFSNYHLEARPVRKINNTVFSVRPRAHDRMLGIRRAVYVDQRLTDLHLHLIIHLGRRAGGCPRTELCPVQVDGYGEPTDLEQSGRDGSSYFSARG